MLQLKILGKPSPIKSSVFSNIVQTAFQPPALVLQIFPKTIEKVCNTQKFIKVRHIYGVATPYYVNIQSKEDIARQSARLPLVPRASNDNISII